MQRHSLPAIHFPYPFSFRWNLKCFFFVLCNCWTVCWSSGCFGAPVVIIERFILRSTNLLRTNEPTPLIRTLWLAHTHTWMHTQSVIIKYNISEDWMSTYLTARHLCVCQKEKKIQRSYLWFCGPHVHAPLDIRGTCLPACALAACCRWHEELLSSNVVCWWTAVTKMVR